MNARCYLCESYSHRILPCPASWQTDPPLIEIPKPQPLAV